ncbi:MAG: galactofuranose transport system permease protein [Humisphaera sp.]|nr:galactofuranose transport system permease protein [Humisphaera sp.]
MTVPTDPISTADPAASSSSSQRYTPRRRVPPIVWPLIALVLIFIILGFSVDPQHRMSSFISVVDNAAPVMLLALGMTLVIATGGIDLSVGAIMALSGMVAAMLITQRGWPVPLAVSAALTAGALAGAWNGFLVAVVRIPPLVATLVLMYAGRGVAMLLSQGQHVRVNSAWFDFIGGGFLLGLPFSIWIVIATLVAITLLTRRTAIGLFIESVGDNPIAARYAGVNAVGVKFSVYVVSGLCSAMAGLIAASDIREADANLIGLYKELDAILAVVIGGTSLAGGRFSLVGSIIGALIVQAVTTTILTRGVLPEMTQVVKAVVVIAVALLQSAPFVRMVSSPFLRRAGATSRGSAP